MHLSIFMHMGGFPGLDTYTLYSVIAAAGFSLSIIFLSLRSLTLRYKGLTRLALSDGFIAVGFLIFAVKGDTSWLAPVLANTLIIAGVSCLSDGVWAFLDRPVRYEPLLYLPPIGAAVLLVYLTFVDKHPEARTLIFSAMLAIQFTATAAVILYRYPFRQKGPSRYTAAVFSVLAIWFAFVCAAAFSVGNLYPVSLFLLAVGLVAWTLGLGIMITMRLAEELAAHEQEVGRLRRDSIIKTVINTIPQSIVLKDKDSRYITCNAEFSRVVGRTPEELVGAVDADLFPLQYAEKYARDDKAVMESGLTEEFVEKTINNGLEAWIETIKTPVIGPDGGSEGVVVVFRDITQRIQEKAKLEESEKKYRELSEQLETRVAERTRELERARRYSDLFFDVTLEYLCLTDFSGRFLKVSPSWTKNLGWQESELMNRNLLDFIHTDDRLSTIVFVRELAAGGRIIDKANRFKRADGSWVWMSWSAVGLPDRGVVLAAVHDITARVETEERMRAARETAEAANQAKSLFISTMSHELRTPLNAVLGYAGLLAPFIKGERAERYIKSIDSSGRALLSIINDILDLTKVESGRIELQMVPFDPRKMMEEIAEIFRFGAEEKGLSLEFKASSKLPKTLLLDAARLRQILINLIGNSIKFTEQGSVSVSLDAEIPVDAQTEDPKAVYSVKFRVSVEDTGIGMTESYRARLFEPFSQQDANVARKYGGTGLGLAIAKRLLDLMDGSIACESEPSVGTRFSVEIPNVRAAGSAAEFVSTIGGGPAKAVPASVEAEPNSVAGRVLIIGENDSTLSAAVKALESPNTELLIARNRDAAIDLAKGADLILMEFDRELFAKLQEDPAASNIPAVLITERKHRDDAMSGFRDGAVDFVSKPIDAEELRARVRVHIDLKKTRDALERKSAEISEGKRAIEKKNEELETLVARLDRLSMTDELTGLANRRAVSSRLAEEVARAKRSKRPITVLMGDLDRFKLVNDQLGHEAGDVVLAESARRFAQALRESDSLGRWGGEEFLAVLPETDLADGLRAAERARERIGDTPIAYGAELVRATISIGAAFLAPQPLANPEQCASVLIKTADDALYRAKAKGRNRVEGIEATLPSVRPKPPTGAS